MDPAALLDGLTEAQRTAVTSEASPLCILAGAGAGKTRALTRRIAYRVATGSADPAHVLALTFTRKAAGELSARLVDLGVRDHVGAGTFHAIAYAQLRRWWADRHQPAPRLLDRKARLLASIAPGRPGLEDLTLAELAADIEWAQARLIPPSGFEEASAAAGRRSGRSGAAVAALYGRYLSEKGRRGLVDFDDLLAGCAAAIDADPGFAAAQRWRWRHVFVDEFQDVNPLQHRLLLAWLGSGTDLCVVGDPNQAIYGWNGADPGLLDGLAQRWPGAEVVRLDANHRCTPQVVAAAAGALGLASGRVRSTRPDGPPVAVRSYESDLAEAHAVVAELLQAHAGGLRWSHLAVLMRTNAQAGAFEAACRAAGVPCRVAGTMSLLDDPAVKAALAAVTRRPGAPLAAVVADLHELAADARGAPARPGQEGPAGGAPARPGLEALAGLATDFQRLDPTASPAAFAAWVAATAGADGTDRPAPADTVTIGTFHRAKGLEWPAVWVTGLEQGLVPIGHATTVAAQAEERRLLYVALTRAERELHCSWARQRRLGGRPVPRQPSPWLAGVVGQDADQGDAGPGDDGPPGEVWRRRFRAERVRLAAGGAGPGRAGTRPAVAGDPAVVGALTVWRAAAARAAAVPAHVLLHDVTLAALATARPSSMEELLAVPGLGPVKVSRYGTTLLELVARHQATA